MALVKLQFGIGFIYSLLVSIGVLFWATFYILFIFIIPFKWRMWRTSSKFEKYLINNGIPSETANQITDSHYKQLSFISIWRWWRALEREKKREHRRKTETSNKTS